MANQNIEKTKDFSALLNEKRINRVFEDLNKLINPDQYLKSKGGLKGLKRLMQDDCIFGALETRFDAATSLSKSFDGPNEGITEFIKEAIGPDCLDEIITGSLRAIPYGFNLTELIYDQLEDGTVILSKALNKGLEIYQLDRQSNVYMSDDYDKSDPAPYAKYVLSRHRADYDNPYGCSILSRLYFAFEFRCHGWEFYIKFLEKFGHPIMYGKLDAKPVDPATGMSNIDQFARLLDSADRPTAIVTDKDSELTVFNPSSNGAQFKEFVECVNKRIYITILGQTLTSDNTGGGSNALGQVHNLVREDKRRHDIRIIEKAVNKVIEYLGFLNDIAEDQLPLFRLEDEKSLNSDRADRDTKLFNMGVEFSDKYLLEHYDLSEDDYTIVDRSQQPVGQFAHHHNCNKFKATPDQRALEALATEASDESEETLDVAELEAILKTSKSKKDFEEKLTTLVGQKEIAFTDLLTDALFQARVQGFVDGDKDVKR